MVSRRRARSGALVDAERSKNVLCNSVSHKQKVSWTQVHEIVHEHEDGCLAGKIYHRFDKRKVAGDKFREYFNEK